MGIKEGENVCLPYDLISGCGVGDDLFVNKPFPQQPTYDDNQKWYDGTQQDAVCNPHVLNQYHLTISDNVPDAMAGQKKEGLSSDKNVNDNIASPKRHPLKSLTNTLQDKTGKHNNHILFTKISDTNHKSKNNTETFKSSPNVSKAVEGPERKVNFAVTAENHEKSVDFSHIERTRWSVNHSSIDSESKVQVIATSKIIGIERASYEQADDDWDPFQWLPLIGTTVPPQSVYDIGVFQNSTIEFNERLRMLSVIDEVREDDEGYDEHETETQKSGGGLKNDYEERSVDNSDILYELTYDHKDSKYCAENISEESQNICHFILQGCIPCLLPNTFFKNKNAIT